ncbi:MAG: hypothetical protein WC334_00650 [Kiritimatiellales bacterium]
MTLKLRHERLAEAHDFAVGFTLRIKIRAALAAAHRKCGQRVFENLFKAEKLQDAGVDAGMEAQSAFIRADGAVEFEAETAVDLNLTFIILPRHAENDLAFRFDEAVQDLCIAQIFAAGHHRLQRFEHFAHSLQEFRLARVAAFDNLQHFFDHTHFSLPVQVYDLILYGIR